MGKELLNKIKQKFLQLGKNKNKYKTKTIKQLQKNDKVYAVTNNESLSIVELIKFSHPIAEFLRTKIEIYTVKETYLSINKQIITIELKNKDRQTTVTIKGKQNIKQKTTKIDNHHRIQLVTTEIKPLINYIETIKQQIIKLINNNNNNNFAQKEKNLTPIKIHYNKLKQQIKNLTPFI